MRLPLRPFALATFSALVLIGCLPTDGKGTSSSSGGTTVDGGDGGATIYGQACLDTADAFAKAAMRCGGDYAAEHAAFIKDLAGGDCNAVTIRNVAELRNRCFPSLATISCTDLMQQRFDPSCAEQIVK